MSALTALLGRLRGRSGQQPADGELLESLRMREASPADTAGGDAALAAFDSLSRIGPLGEAPADLDAEFKPPPDY